MRRISVSELNTLKIERCLSKMAKKKKPMKKGKKK